MRRLQPAATSLALVVLVLGPALLRPGYLIAGDMVFVPDMPWKSSHLGLDGSLPRAVPTDAFVWLLTTVIPGWLVQKALLAGSIALAVYGVQRLLADAPAVAQVAASVALVWTPYTFDRLAIGHWSLLASTAVLPWVVLAARSGRWPAIVVALAGAAVLSPSGGVTAAAVALAVAVACRGPWVPTASLGVVVNLPWVVPGLLSDATTPTDVASVEAFAARAESSLGVLPSVLTGGGIWKAGIVAPERSQELLVACSLLLTAVALVAVARRRTPELLGLATVATLGLVLCLCTAWAPEALAALQKPLPGLGILRDSTRYLAPLVLLVAVGVGQAVGALVQRWSALALVLVVWPVAVLPSLAWGQLGDLEPADYPDEWHEVRTELEADPLDGPLVVLPWQGTYRRFDWNHDRAALDPAPRFFPGEVLLDDRVFLDDVVLPNEDDLARRVTQALESDDVSHALAAEGVGGVLVERTSPGATSYDGGGKLEHRGPELELWRVSRPGDSPAKPGSDRRAIVAIDLLCGLLVTFGLLLLAGKHRYTLPRRL